MKKYYFIGFMLLGTFFAQSQASYLDSSFYNNGVLRGTPSVGNDHFQQVFVRPDGKTLILGYSERELRYPDPNGHYSATFTSIVQWLPDGTLDPAFGDGGTLRISGFTSGCLLSDGKLLLAFNRHYFDGNELISWVELQRLNLDGSPDLNFGVNGVVVRPELARCSDIQMIEASGGRVLLGGTVVLPDSIMTDHYDCFLARLLPDGALDPLFGAGGIHQFDYQTSFNTFKTFDKDPEGRIVVLFNVTFLPAGDDATVVGRFDSNGELDTDFAQGGYYLTEFGDGKDLVVHPDGHTWVVMISGWADTYGLLILDENGQLVQQQYWFGDYHYYNGSPLAVQSDGKVVAVTRYGMWSGGNDSTTWQILRFLPNGAMDAGYPLFFPLLRQHLTDAGGENWDIALDPADRLLLAGLNFDQFWDLDYQWFKLNAAHTLDPSFGQNGFVTQNMGTSLSSVSALIQDQQSRVLLLAEGYNGTLLRMTPEGAPDPGFAHQGVLPLGPAPDPGYHFAHTLVVETSDGGILSAGAADDYLHLYGLAHWYPDGRIDSTFGPQQNGYTFLSGDYYTSVDDYNQAIGLGLQPNGKPILIAANKNVYVDTSRTWLIRFLPEGDIDSSFAQNGVMSANPGTGFFNIKDGQVLSDGKILVTGVRKTTVNGPQQTYLAQYVADGTLDPGFGSGGLKLDPFSIAFAFKPYALSMQADGKILLAGVSGGATNPKLALGRLLPNGSKDNTFSGDGFFTLEAGPGLEALTDVAVQPDGRIVGVGKVDVEGDTSDIILLRWLSDGTIDSTFGQNGALVTTLPGDNEPLHLLVQNNGKYIVGGFDEDRYIAIRYLPSLSVNLDEIPLLEQVLVYPNPVLDRVVLALQLERGMELSIDMVDAAGRQVAVLRELSFLEKGSQSLPLQIPGALTAGWYALRIHTPQGVQAVRVLLEQR